VEHRLQALEYAEQASSPNDAWGYLSIARAFTWMIGPDFEQKTREIAMRRSGLSGDDLDRLIRGSQAATTDPDSLDESPQGGGDSMPYDSDGDPDVVPAWLRAVHAAARKRQ
jgi:hypothetical protein